MLFLPRFFLGRIPREGFRSLIVPALALVLVMLIILMGSVRDRQTDGLEDVLNQYEVRVEVSDPVSSAVDGIRVSSRHIGLFTDGEAWPSLAPLVKDVELRRSLVMVGDGAPDGSLVGVTSALADVSLSPVAGAYMVFFDGYGEDIFRTERRVCVVSESMYGALDPAAPVLAVTVRSEAGPAEPVEAELMVVGLTYGAGNTVYCPFWTASALGSESDRESAYSELMSALIADNRRVDDFKAAARNHFVAAGVVRDGQLDALSLTVYDGTFNEVIRSLRQNILIINIAAPFVYFISACIGFMASFLLTRRRKPEFAVMRSMGVGKADVFAGALAEQSVLCFAGVFAGVLLFYAFSGRAVVAAPAVFMLCYSLGSALSAANAAGTDVLKILREKG